MGGSGSPLARSGSGDEEVVQAHLGFRRGTKWMGEFGGRGRVGAGRLWPRGWIGRQGGWSFYLDLPGPLLSLVIPPSSLPQPLFGLLLAGFGLFQRWATSSACFIWLLSRLVGLQLHLALRDPSL